MSKVQLWVTVPREVSDGVDRRVALSGLTRSQWVAQALADRIEAEDDIDAFERLVPKKTPDAAAAVLDAWAEREEARRE